MLKNNERVNILGSWKHGFFAYSAIGALNVGSIEFDHEKELVTNQKSPVRPYLEDVSYTNSFKSANYKS